jgi:hypothetical protein
MASAQILTNGKALYAYNGTEWVPLNTTGNLVNSTRWQYTAVGSETSLSGNDDNGESLIYTPGFEQVYLNGVLLARDADYTATTGTTITGLTALTAGYIVEIIAYNNINVGNTYTQGQIDNKIANTFTRWIDTLSASATVLSGLDDNSTTLSYTPGLEQVYVNGILLLPSEYTATSGSSVVLSEAAVENDVIQIYTLKNFRVPNTYTIGQTDDQFLTKTSASSTYLTQSSASTTYAPVAAGGLVQIVPNPIAVTGGSGSISATGAVSFTSASSVSINNCFSSAYDRYVINVDCDSASTNIDVFFRLRVSNTDAATNYSYAGAGYRASGTGFNPVSTSATSVDIGRGGTSYVCHSTFQAVDPFNAVPTVLLGQFGSKDSASTFINNFGAYHSDSTSYTGFTIFPNTGTISGSVRIYGYRN